MSFMPSPVQIELWHAEKVATQVGVTQAANGIHYAVWGENRISETDLERLVSAVPATLSGALENRAYYFVPLAIADTGDIMVAPSYSVELGDRAICHRNTVFGSTEAVFISTRLVEDRFGLAFEFFINIAHNFVEAAGVPESFSSLAWSQAEAQVRGETSQDAWETRRRAQGHDNNGKTIDERARNSYFRSGVCRCAGGVHAFTGGGLRLPRSARTRVSAAGRSGAGGTVAPCGGIVPGESRLRIPDSLSAQGVREALCS